jgi:hypothetical protein
MRAARMYLEEFRQRGEAASAQRFGRQELLTEAAHDAYQATADRLTQQHGWDDERTLVVMRGLNAAVQRWLDSGGGDWAVLGRSLEEQEAALHGSGEGGAGEPEPPGSESGDRPGSGG